MKSLILDMDQTILSREVAGDYPNNTDTIKQYCKKASLFVLYHGWEGVFSYIRENNIKVAIVSDAHELIIEAAISRFNIPCDCDFAIGHFAADNKKKPDPFPMFKALKLMAEAPENVLSFGDSLNDYLAASGANIKHYGCMWASTPKEEALLRENNCRNFIYTPKQIIEILNC